MSTLGAIGVAAGSLTAIFLLFKWLIPAVVSVFEFFVDAKNVLALFSGRKPTTDPVTGEELPEVPALGIGMAQNRKQLQNLDARVSELATTMSDLTGVVQQLADQQVELAQFGRTQAEHSARLDTHDDVIAAILAGTYLVGSEKQLRAAEKMAESQHGDVVPPAPDEKP